MRACRSSASRGACVALLLSLVAFAPAGAGEAGITVDEVLAALRAKGHEASIAAAGGAVPRIDATVDGAPYSVSFYRCEAGRCGAFEFGASDDILGAAVSLEAINDWNAETVFGKAVRDVEGNARIEFGVLAAPGLTPAALAGAIDEWAGILLEFEEFLFVEAELGPGTADGAAGAPGQAAIPSTIEVCNESGDEVSLAYATAAGGTSECGETLYRSQGWRIIAAGACSDLWESPFANRYYYVFAHGDDGSYGGDYYFCTLDDRFEIVDTQCTDDYQREGFLQIDMAEGNRMQEGFRLDLRP